MKTKSLLSPIAGWVFYFEAPKYERIVTLIDALKLCLIYHGVEYYVHIESVRATIAFELEPGMSAILTKDETFARISTQLRGIIDDAHA